MKIVILGQALIHHSVTWPEELQALTHGADAVLCNFEGCLPPDDAWPMKQKTVHAAHPKAGVMLRNLGVTQLALANNHAWDFGHAGLLSTRSTLERSGFGVAGAGHNLASASAAAIYNGVALLSVDAGPTPDWAIAGTGPGVNALRLTCTLGLPAKLLTDLETVTIITGKAQKSARRRAIGYDSLTPQRDFYGLALEGSGEPREIWRCPPQDTARIVADIQRAQTQAKFVIVALHYHHWSVDWGKSPDWLSDLAETLLEAGADALACTGPPIAGEVRIAGGKAFASSLGNVVFHTARARKYDALRIPVRQGCALIFEDGAWRSVVVEALVPSQ